MKCEILKKTFELFQLVSEHKGMNLEFNKSVQRRTPLVPPYYENIKKTVSRAGKNMKLKDKSPSDSNVVKHKKCVGNCEAKREKYDSGSA